MDGPLALAAGFAHAADPEPTQLETIHVKGEGLTSTHRVNIKSLEESTATDLKKVLFNEPAISFGGGTGQFAEGLAGQRVGRFPVQQQRPDARMPFVGVDADELAHAQVSYPCGARRLRAAL